MLQRNPTFRQLRADAVNMGARHADRIALSVMPEQGVAFPALMSRELSAAALRTDTVERRSCDRDFRIMIDGNAKNLSFLAFAFRAPFDGPRMREAVTCAIDRAALVRAAYASYAVEVPGPMARGIPGCDEAAAREFGLGPDPARARALLAAGVETTLDPARRQVFVSEAQKLLLPRAIAPPRTNHNLLRPGDLRMANWQEAPIGGYILRRVPQAMPVVIGILLLTLLIRAVIPTDAVTALYEGRSPTRKRQPPPR